jgi:hypothetical protein
MWDLTGPGDGRLVAASMYCLVHGLPRWPRLRVGSDWKSMPCPAHVAAWVLPRPASTGLQLFVSQPLGWPARPKLRVQSVLLVVSTE